MNDYLKLKSCASYVDDKIHSSKLTTSNYITTDNMLQNKCGIEKAETLPAVKSNVTRFKRGDILVANIRPYLKKIWHATFDGGCSADVLVIRATSTANSKFIYYSLFRDDFFIHAMNGSKGTKMPRGDKAQIMDFNIPKMDDVSQIQISVLLSNIDKKIKLNNRINAELEAMAKTLYDYWFVQFDFPDDNGQPYKASGGKMVYNEILKREIPEGWKVAPVSEWIVNDKSGDWGKEETQGNYTQKVACIRGTDLNGLNGTGSLNPPTRYILEKNTHKILEENDLIIEISGGSPTQSTGRLGYITKDTLNRFATPIICSNFCKAIALNKPEYLFTFVQFWQRIYEHGVLFCWEGKTSGIKNLLFDSFISNYMTEIPSEELNHKFHELMKPIQAKKQKTLEENQKLTELRDWLLPMLMNGQVTIK